MSAELDRGELGAYLQVLAGGAPGSAFLELRYRVAEDILRSQFLPAWNFSELADAIARRATTTDVYVGCAPRCRRSGTKHDIREVWVLWAECDGAAAANAAWTYQPAPSIVIASGSGPNVHAYWPLRTPLAPQDVERGNLRLAYALGADRKCFDAARILRPPGTRNHKHQPPARVTALRLNAGVSFSARDVLERAPEISDDRLPHRWREPPTRTNRGDPLLELLPAIYVSDLLGVQARPGRKVHCPFHSDQHASLHVYPTPARGWCCFSCGRGGSIYDLAAAVWGTGTRGRDFVQLRRLLTERFARGLRHSSPTRGCMDRHVLD